MIPHTHLGGGCFVLILALTAPGGAAQESPNPVGSSPPPAPANAVATPASSGTANAPAPKARPKLSPQIAGEVIMAVPVWNPPPKEPADKPPPPPPDTDVVKMARVVVWDYRLPRIDEKDWLTPKAKDVELVNTYITPLDRFLLSRFTLPIFGVSQEARARMMYEEDKRLQSLKWINEEIDQIKLLDPAEAKALTNIRDTTFTQRQP